MPVNSPGAAQKAVHICHIITSPPRIVSGVHPDAFSGIVALFSLVPRPYLLTSMASGRWREAGREVSEPRKSAAKEMEIPVYPIPGLPRSTNT